MRTNAHIAVGSPMARVAAIAVATMLLLALVAGAGIAGARLLAADAAIVVARDGSGDYTTISQAVAVAEDGDTVLVRPGTYVEAVVIEADITLSGDGPVEEIIVEAPEDGPEAPTGDGPGGNRPAAYALLLQDSVATVSGLTFRGEASRVHAKGGAPVFEGLVLRDVDRPHVDGSGSDLGGLIVSGGSQATVRDSVFEGGHGILVDDVSEPLITGNTLRGGAGIGGGFGDGTIIRDNQISGTVLGSIGILSPTAALIEGNSITGSGTGIWIGHISGEGVQPFIRSNSVSGCLTGILVSRGAAPTIEGNTLTGSELFGIRLSDGAGPARIAENDFSDNGTGIIASQTDAHIEGNTIEGGAAGVVILRHGTPTISGNTVEEAANYGIRVQGGAAPTLTGNRICDNGTNLVLDEGAEPTMQGNDICPDPTSSPDG